MTLKNFFFGTAINNLMLDAGNMPIFSFKKRIKRCISREKKTQKKKQWNRRNNDNYFMQETCRMRKSKAPSTTTI